MTDNFNQPREDDAVKGGQAPAPEGSAVLGGLEGVKRRLSSSLKEERIIGLSQVLNYGEAGFDLVMQALQDSCEQVRQKAFWVLQQQRTAPVVKPGLQEYPPLKEAVNVDYTRLRDLLAAEKWKEADHETLALMLIVCNQQKNGWLDVEDIKRFPCIDLRTIDQLWVKHSNGRFGFSVQKQIWRSVGGKLNADWETYCRFGERVGWRIRNRWLDEWNLTYTLGAPIGHLPALGEDRLRITVHLRAVGDALFSQLDACEL